MIKILLVTVFLTFNITSAATDNYAYDIERARKLIGADEYAILDVMGDPDEVWYDFQINLNEETFEKVLIYGNAKTRMKLDSTGDHYYTYNSEGFYIVDNECVMWKRIYEGDLNYAAIPRGGACSYARIADVIKGIENTEFKETEKAVIGKLLSWENGRTNTEAYVLPVTEERYDPENGFFWYGPNFDTYRLYGLDLISSSYLEIRDSKLKALKETILKTEYGGNGRKLRDKWFDGDGNRKELKGVHCIDYSYDSEGNKISERYSDENGYLYTTPSKGALIKWEYDDNGNIISEYYFDNNYNPISRDGGHGPGKAYRYEWTYDENGRRITESYFNGKGEPAVFDAYKGFFNSEGCHKYEWTYDEAGNKTSSSRFNTSGNPQGNIHKTEWTYDENGNRLSETYFGIEGKPYQIIYDKAKSKIHKIRWEYDDLGRKISKTYFDKNNKPTNNSNMVHKVVWEYDVNGNKSSESYYNKKDKPVESWGVSIYAGVHRIEWEYDIYGNKISESYFGKKDEPIDDVLVHRYEWTYDSNGNKSSVRKYDVNGVLIYEAEFK
jgi:hypothetical protein